jgi:hypothetical protein
MMATATHSSKSTHPEIVESYREFEPPPNFKSTVETLLRCVPPKYLIGLKTIVLTNQAGLTSKQRKQKTWSRKHKVRLAECLGSYHASTRTEPASIWLYVDNIVESGIRWWYRVPVLRYAVACDVLHHEIGHHIHKVHRPVYEEKENVAENWSDKLPKNFYRKHYWYIYPLLYVLARILSPIFKLLKKQLTPKVE